MVIDKEILDEFKSRIQFMQFERQYQAGPEGQDGTIPIYQIGSTGESGKHVCDLQPDGRFLYHESKEAAEVVERFNEVKEYVNAYKAAPHLEYEGVKKHKKLCEFQNVVLAAKKFESRTGMNGISAYEFVTWRVEPGNRENRGVGNGNYFTDYISAKENFAKRAGLIDSMRYFNKDQLKSVYMNFGDDIDYGRFHLPASESSDVQQFLSKLKCVFPDMEPSPEIRLMKSHNLNL